MIRILQPQALPLRAAVHSGPFHADDVLCAAFLYLAYGRDNVQVIRSRDPEVLAACDFVLDVGGKDEITDTRVCLDHHQPGSLIRENGVKAAACGKLADLMFADEPRLLSLMRDVFLDDVEAMDNGQRGPGHHLFSFVHSMNPTWKDPRDREDEFFLEAAGMAETVLRHLLERLRARLEAEGFIKRAIAETYDRGVIRLDGCYDWIRQVVSYNAAHPDRKDLYVIFPTANEYDLQAVPAGPDTFVSERPLPAEWAGKRSRELAEVTGIQGSVFCHVGRFLAVFRTLEEAVRASELALSSEIADN